MSKHLRLITLLALAAVTATQLLYAQDQNSPYSRYGYGNLRDNATSAQRAMGSVGYAMQSGRQINVMNPASYAAIDSLTFLFDMGIDYTRQWASDGDNRKADYGGGLDYVTMQFPIGKRMGMSLGLLPFSSTGYAFGNEIGNGSSTFQGLGGINIAYLGAAIRPWVPGLSVGFNAGYMFGTTRNDNYIFAQNGASSLFEQVMEVSDYYLQFGAQYACNINRKNRLTAGLTFTPAKTLRGSAYGLKYDIDSESDEPQTTESISMNHNFGTPDCWGFGVGYTYDSRIAAEVDYTWQNWSNARFRGLEGFEKTTFTDRRKVAAGFSYIHNPRGGWLQRVQWRAGAYTERDYILIRDNHLTRRGVTAGFGLPAPRGKTLINIGLEYSERRAHPSPLVKEQQLFLTIGVNFNELWFWQSKLQ